MDLGTIRAGLAANLGTVDGVRVYPEWPSKPEAPCVCVRADDPHIEPWQTSGHNLTVFHFILDVVLSTNPTPARAQKRVDALISEDLVDALMSDRTLGGAAEDVIWTATSGPRSTVIGGVEYLGCEISFDVRARHS